MIIRCEKCDTKFRLDDERVVHRAVKVKCTKCNNIFIVYPPQPVEEAQVQEIASTPAAEEGAAGEEGEKPSLEEKGTGEEHGEEEEDQWVQPPRTPPASGPAFDFGASGTEEGAKETGEEAFSTGHESAKEVSPEDAGEGDPDTGGLETGAPPSEGDFSGDTEEAGPGGEKHLEEDSEEDADEGFSGRGKDYFDEDSGEFRGFGPTEERDADRLEVRPPQEERPPVSQTKGEGAGRGKKTRQFTLDFEREEGTDAGSGLLQRDIDEMRFPGGRPSNEGRQGKNIVRLFIVLAVVVGVSALISYFMHRNDAASSPVGIERLNGFYAENRSLGKLFVIEGNIRNMTDRPIELKGIRGRIFDTGGDEIAEETVSPGRVVTSEEIENLDGEALLKPFNDLSEGVLPPGANMPVMVLFTGIPERIGEYELDVVRK